jgi:hypothetical protein
VSAHSHLAPLHAVEQQRVHVAQLAGFALAAEYNLHKQRSSAITTNKTHALKPCDSKRTVTRSVPCAAKADCLSSARYALPSTLDQTRTA